MAKPRFINLAITPSGMFGAKTASSKDRYVHGEALFIASLFSSAKQRLIFGVICTASESDSFGALGDYYGKYCEVNMLGLLMNSTECFNKIKVLLQQNRNLGAWKILKPGYSCFFFFLIVFSPL